MVCRVFQKCNTIMKKPQATSSSPQSLESPCDTNAIANELGDIELPNFNSMPSPSNGIINNHNNISLQSYSSSNEGMNMNMNLNMNMNSTLPLLPWPPTTSLLSSNLSSVNSLLFRALQLRGHHQAISTSDYTYSMPQAGNNAAAISQFGNDFINTNDFAAAAATSSSLVLDSVNQHHHQQQQQQQQQHPQEQPFKDSHIW